MAFYSYFILPLFAVLSISSIDGILGARMLVEKTPGPAPTQAPATTFPDRDFLPPPSKNTRPSLPEVMPPSTPSLPSVSSDFLKDAPVPAPVASPLVPSLSNSGISPPPSLDTQPSLPPSTSSPKAMPLPSSITGRTGMLSQNAAAPAPSQLVTDLPSSADSQSPSAMSSPQNLMPPLSSKELSLPKATSPSSGLPATTGMPFNTTSAPAPKEGVRDIPKSTASQASSPINPPPNTSPSLSNNQPSLPATISPSTSLLDITGRRVDPAPAPPSAQIVPNFPALAESQAPVMAAPPESPLSSFSKGQLALARSPSSEAPSTMGNLSDKTAAPGPAKEVFPGLPNSGVQQPISDISSPPLSNNRPSSPEATSPSSITGMIDMLSSSVSSPAPSNPGVHNFSPSTVAQSPSTISLVSKNNPPLPMAPSPLSSLSSIPGNMSATNSSNDPSKLAKPGSSRPESPSLTNLSQLGSSPSSSLPNIPRNIAGTNSSLAPAQLLDPSSPQSQSPSLTILPPSGSPLHSAMPIPGNISGTNSSLNPGQLLNPSSPSQPLKAQSPSSSSTNSPQLGSSPSSTLPSILGSVPGTNSSLNPGQLLNPSSPNSQPHDSQSPSLTNLPMLGSSPSSSLPSIPGNVSGTNSSLNLGLLLNPDSPKSNPQRSQSPSLTNLPQLGSSPSSSMPGVLGNVSGTNSPLNLGQLLNGSSPESQPRGSQSPSLTNLPQLGSSPSSSLPSIPENVSGMNSSFNLGKLLDSGSPKSQPQESPSPSLTDMPQLGSSPSSGLLGIPRNLSGTNSSLIPSQLLNSSSSQSQSPSLTNLPQLGSLSPSSLPGILGDNITGTESPIISGQLLNHGSPHSQPQESQSHSLTNSPHMGFSPSSGHELPLRQDTMSLTSMPSLPNNQLKLAPALVPTEPAPPNLQIPKTSQSPAKMSPRNNQLPPSSNSSPSLPINSPIQIPNPSLMPTNSKNTIPTQPSVPRFPNPVLPGMPSTKNSAEGATSLPSTPTSPMDKLLTPNIPVKASDPRSVAPQIPTVSLASMKSNPRSPNSAISLPFHSPPRSTTRSRMSIYHAD